MMSECGICFDADADVRALCDNGHAFHPECLRRWNEINPRCPVCREPVPFCVMTRNHTLELQRTAEQAALVQQVMSLTEGQINALPPEQARMLMEVRRRLTSQ